MIFGRQAFFGYSVRPSGEVFWFANVAATEAESRHGTTPPTGKAACGRCSPATPVRRIDIIEATDRELAAYPIFDMPTVATLARGPMVMTGDAAHATSPSAGQGASMAMEDAVVLALCLRDASDASEAFAAYERLRRPRVERVVRYSARVGQTKIAWPDRPMGPRPLHARRAQAVRESRVPTRGSTATTFRGTAARRPSAPRSRDAHRRRGTVVRVLPTGDCPHSPGQSPSRFCAEPAGAR